MPSIIQPWAHRHKKPLLFGAGMALLVLLVAVGYWAYHAYMASRDNQDYATAQKIANLDAAAGKFDLAANVWSEYAAKSPNKDHRYQALLQAASLYITAGHYDQAATSCRQAEKIMGVTFQEAEVAATAYTRLGQKQTAIYYYRQAIKLEPASYSDGPADKADFTRAITQLSAQP